MGDILGAASVEVVIPTRGNRPELLARAVASAAAQEYAGDLGIAIVFDDAEPALPAVDAAVPIRMITNYRTPGLAGTRNSGIETSAADLVAFLDDDDRWLPGKLARQTERLVQSGQDFATTAMVVDFQGTESARRAGCTEVTHEQLTASRMAMLHSSTFLVRRAALLDAGMVDEAAPFGQNEDWDLLLRFSRKAPIVHVDEPLVAVQWGSTSMFAQAWQAKIDGLNWILSRHEDVRGNDAGHARVLGQIAFAQAALRQRGPAFRTAARAARTRWREPRAYLAMLAATGIVSAERILRTLHKRGHGI
jgi:glycosyltransferase involved in cell wall biosynthesis